MGLRNFPTLGLPILSCQHQTVVGLVGLECVSHYNKFPCFVETFHKLCDSREPWLKQLVHTDTWTHRHKHKRTHTHMHTQQKGKETTKSTLFLPILQSSCDGHQVSSFPKIKLCSPLLVEMRFTHYPLSFLYSVTAISSMPPPELWFQCQGIDTVFWNIHHIQPSKN